MTQQVVTQNILNNTLVPAPKSGLDYGKATNDTRAFESVLEKADKTIMAEKKMINSDSAKITKTTFVNDLKTVNSNPDDTNVSSDTSVNTEINKDSKLEVSNNLNSLDKSQNSSDAECENFSDAEKQNTLIYENPKTSNSSSKFQAEDVCKNSIISDLTIYNSSEFQENQDSELLNSQNSKLLNSVNSINVESAITELKNKISELVSQMLSGVTNDANSESVDTSGVNSENVSNLTDNLDSVVEEQLDNIFVEKESVDIDLAEVDVSTNDSGEKSLLFEENALNEDSEILYDKEITDKKSVVNLTSENKLINELLGSVFVDKLDVSIDKDMLAQLNQLAQDTSLNVDTKLEILNSLLESSDIRVSDVLINNTSTDIDLSTMSDLLQNSVNFVPLKSDVVVENTNYQVPDVKLFDSKMALSIGSNLSSNIQDIGNTKLGATSEAVNTIIVDATEDIVVDVDTEVVNIKDSRNAEVKLDLSQELVDELDVEISNLSQRNASTQNGSSFLGQQSSQEQLMKMAVTEQLNSSLNSTQNSFDKIISSQNTSAPKDITKADIMAQIQAKLDGSNIQHQTKLTMVLNPESLGKVSIELVNTKEGMIAQMTVASSEVKDILDKSIDNLKSSLAAQGVNVENVSVKTSESAHQELDYTEQDSNEHSQQQKNKQNRDSDSQSETFEDIVAKGLNKDEASETVEA